MIHRGRVWKSHHFLVFEEHHKSKKIKLNLAFFVSLLGRRSIGCLMFIANFRESGTFIGEVRGKQNSCNAILLLTRKTRLANGKLQNLKKLCLYSLGARALKFLQLLELWLAFLKFVPFLCTPSFFRFLPYIR